MLGDGDSGIPDVANVRLLVPVQRRGDADGDKVHILDEAEVGGGAQHTGLHQLLQVGVHHVADIVFPGVYQVYLLLLHIETNGLEAVLGLVHRQGQAHIAQAAHAHDQGLVLYFLKQFFFYAHVNRTP